MKKKIALAIVLVALAVNLFAWWKLSQRPTPEQIIEKRGYCDAIYFAHEDGDVIRNSWFIGWTPAVGVGVIWDRDNAPTMSLNNDDVGMWLGDVVEAALAVEEEWRVIEIDVLFENDGKLELGGTILIWRKEAHGDRYLGEFEWTVKEYRQMINSGQIGAINTLVCPRPYVRGMNCEVQEKWKRYFSTGD